MAETSIHANESGFDQADNSAQLNPDFAYRRTTPKLVITFSSLIRTTKHDQTVAQIVILGDLVFGLRVGDMKDKILATLLALLLPSLTFAQAPHNYSCSLGDLTRRVEILYETGVTVPCEVHYYKDTEAPGETQVLWRALNEAGYCERMAESFITKLRDLGWTCGQGAAGEAAAPATEPASDAEPAESDDTDSLDPAEDSEPTEE